MTEWHKWAEPPALRPDWDERFTAWLEEEGSKPHDWEGNHCLLHVAGAIEAQTGRDFAKGRRRKFKSAAGSKRYLSELGFKSVAALLDSILDPVDVAFAQRGDIALAHDGAGVVIGGEALILVHGHDAPVRVPRSDWKKAWAVGRRTEAGA